MKNFRHVFVVFVALAIFQKITHALPEEEVEADEDDIIDVENEETNVLAEEEAQVEEVITSSKDVDTLMLFVLPPHSPGVNLELPAGHMAEFLIGVLNKGEIDYIIENINASFRYPMDFNFYIQNFTTLNYNKLIKPSHEATLAYTFYPSESFAGRPFGFNVNLNYRDANGVSYSEAIYNETVQIVELDEGLDGETVFLYIFLAACVVLALVGGQQILSSFGKKTRLSIRKPAVELGTLNPNNIDFEWIPKQTLNMFHDLPKKRSKEKRQRKFIDSDG